MKTHYLHLVFLLLTFSMHAQPGKLAHATESFLHPPPVPVFYITGLCFGDSTHFINKTLYADISWAITNDKGDTLYVSKAGTFSYYFKKRGMYQVCLTADNGHLATKIRTIAVDTIVHADFTYRPCFNEFDNQSTCFDHAIWTLPDTFSTEAAPVYQFKEPGPHVIKLLINKGNKTDTITKVIAVPGDSLGTPDSTYIAIQKGTYTFDFIAKDSLASGYIWNFGDQQFDETNHYKVTHTFDMSKYSPPVELRISNGCGITFADLDPFKPTAILKKNALHLNVTIYPNPVTEEVYVSITNATPHKSIRFRLMSSTGAVVIEHTGVATSDLFQLTFNTVQLGRGIYMLEVLTMGELISKKIIIQ